MYCHAKVKQVDMVTLSIKQGEAFLSSCLPYVLQYNLYTRIYRRIRFYSSFPSRATFAVLPL